MGGGGAERVAANLANAWTARRDSVLLLATFSGRGECFFKLNSEVQLEFLADRVERSDRSLASRAARLLALRKIVRDYRPDVVVSFLTNVNVAAIPACLGLGIPVVVSERSYPPMDVFQSRALDALRRLTYPLADRVVMVTSKGRDWLERSIPRARAAVIPNPISAQLPLSEPSLLPADYIEPQRKVLLAVGRLDGGKQIDIAIDAFATLAAAHPTWDLVVLGDGPDRAALQRQVERSALGSRVRLLGQVGNVGDWYVRADLYVLASRYEGFPNTLAEAMAHGCAAVSYDCDTGPRDIIRDQIDGLLVHPVGHVGALAAALGRLMASDTERACMSVRAREVGVRFSTQTVLAQWDRLFEQVAGAS